MDLDLASAERQKTSAGVTRGAGQGVPSQNPKAVAAVLLLFVLLVGSYTLGQLGSGSTSRALPETGEPTPETVVTQALPGTDLLQARPLIGDLLGPGRIVSGLGLGHGNQALVFCRAQEPTSGLAPSLVIAHAGIREGQDYLISYVQIASPAQAPDSCNSCAPVRADLFGETIMVGSCVSGDGTATAYVIASNAEFWDSPVAVVVRCPGAGVEFEVGEGELILRDRLRHGTTEGGNRQVRPPTQFVRSEGRFVADGLELLGASCDLNHSNQLVGWDSSLRSSSGTLSYDVIESGIGPIGVHGSVLIALNDDQCLELVNAWWAPQGRLGEPIFAPLEELTGLNAPDDGGDWYYLCGQQGG